MASLHSGLLKTNNEQGVGEFITILSQVFGQLIIAVERIQAGPHHRLSKINTVIIADQVKRAGSGDLKFLAKRPHYLVKDMKAGFIRRDLDYYRPVRLIENKPKIDYDTKENRFLRWMLAEIRQKLRMIKVPLSQLNDRVLLKRLELMERGLGRLLEADFLAEVRELRQIPENSVWQMTPIYRDVYLIYLQLNYSNRHMNEEICGN